MSGVLYGVGVGPGDPELLTLKALRIIKSAQVIAYPTLEDGNSFARSIVAEYLSPEQSEIAVRVPMTARRAPAQQAYDRAAEAIAARLDAGDDVAALCEGDPFFYGSFMYLFGRLAERSPVVVTPGVSSLTACAASLGAPLCARNDVLTVLPAPLPDETLAARLAEADGAAIVKVGRHFARIGALLDRLGLSDRAHYIERATLPNQTVRPLSSVASGAAPYFSMILLHRRGDAWRWDAAS